MPAERDGHPIDLQQSARPCLPASLLTEPTTVLRTHMAACIDPSDVARLRSQVSLCENEIFTLRERLRVANAACSSKDQKIQQLQARIDKDIDHLGGTREWCGGPCRGTRPIRSKEQKRERKRSQNRSECDRLRQQAAEETEVIDEEPELDSAEHRPSRRSSQAASELEHMLDQEIARHRDSDIPQMMAEWDQETGAVMRPASPHHALPWELSGDNNYEGDHDAMAQLDQEIEAAHHQEELLLRHEETIRKLLPKK